MASRVTAGARVKNMVRVSIAWLACNANHAMLSNGSVHTASRVYDIVL